MNKAEWREGLSCEERDRAIESILDVALPACETSRGRMRENLAALSLRALFFGIEDCAILAVIIALAGAVPMAFMTEPEHSALAVFMLAPLFFATLQGLVAWKDRESGTIAWRAVCRMTVLELHAVRMLVFGAMAILFTVPLAAAAWIASAYMVSFWWMLSLAAASLAIFGAFSFCFFGLARQGERAGGSRACRRAGADYRLDAFRHVVGGTSRIRRGVARCSRSGVLCGCCGCDGFIRPPCHRDLHDVLR